MSEEEIIKNAKEMIYNAECWIDDEEYSGAEEREWAKFEKDTIEGLLDLYNAEKEKNKEIKEIARNNPPKTIIFPTTIINEEGDLEDINIKYTLLEGNYIDKWIIEDKIEELKDKEQELTDEQGYWGSTALQEKIELLEELLEE